MTTKKKADDQGQPHVDLFREHLRNHGTLTPEQRKAVADEYIRARQHLPAGHQNALSPEQQQDIVTAAGEDVADQTDSGDGGRAGKR